MDVAESPTRTGETSDAGLVEELEEFVTFFFLFFFFCDGLILNPVVGRNNFHFATARVPAIKCDRHKRTS